jgi:uncharacterized protein YdeI (YjbR/CyaY-like superfamily)
MPPNPSSLDLPLLHVPDRASWEAWLDDNAETSSGVWLRLARKDSGLVSVSYVDAVEAALCHGWIDGQKKSFDDQSSIQRFTPRRARSLWSKINRERATRLLESGMMRPGGLKAIEAARADGRWDRAYDSPRSATVPDELERALAANPAAKAFFESLNSANRFAIIFRVQTARKPETRARWVERLVDMLERGEKLHP